MMKRSYKVPIASFISLLLGIYFIYNDGTFLIHHVLLLFLVVFGAIPALITFMFSKFVYLIDSIDLKKPIPQKLTTCKVILAFTIIQFVCAGFASSVMKKRTADAKLFCNELIVHLEQQEEQNGKYPANIEDYLNNHNLPYRLKTHRLHYWNQGNKYTLSFRGTGGMFPRSHEYDSQKREWVVLD